MENNKKSKQVIVVNVALNMPPGKLGPQVAHASVGALFELGKKENTVFTLNYEEGSALQDWMLGSFTKVLVKVKSEAKLLSIYEKAKKEGKPCVLIQDEGRTFFEGVPTYTCVGIGPMHEDDFIGLTDKLQLL